MATLIRRMFALAANPTPIAVNVAGAPVAALVDFQIPTVLERTAAYSVSWSTGSRTISWTEKVPAPGTGTFCSSQVPPLSVERQRPKGAAGFAVGQRWGVPPPNKPIVGEGHSVGWWRGAGGRWSSASVVPGPPDDRG